MEIIYGIKLINEDRRKLILSRLKELGYTSKINNKTFKNATWYYIRVFNKRISYSKSPSIVTSFSHFRYIEIQFADLYSKLLL